VEPELGVWVHVRDVEKLDDLGDVTAPPPVEPGDLVASVDDLFRVEVVLVPKPGARVVPVLARRLDRFSGADLVRLT
jgi:hypothetical protein